MPSRKSTPKAEDIVVVESTRDDDACAECGEELGPGHLLCIEEGRPLCLTCADLDHLVYVPRGDAALTRRASKYSTLRAVVVRFSRSRKRNERQGVLVEEGALERAERECLADAEARASQRERRAEREVGLDAEYRARFADRVAELFPGCPADEAVAIAEHACQKHSGRVGRTAAAKELDPAIIELAVRAHVRHVHTRYDELLGSGWERRDARSAVADEVEGVLRRWRERD